MRIVFMGTPDFAVPSLNALAAAGHEVCGVFSQPDKPVGRHQNKLKPTPVKMCAMDHDIPVYQPLSMRDGEALSILKELRPELIVVAAFGRLLPDEILKLPEKGCINVHSSLLPKYRGSAPINWAVVNGEQETGVTIMHMATELDGGDIIDQIHTAIDPDEDVEAVHDRLARLGGKLLVKVVSAIADGSAARTPQEPSQVTYAPMLSRELCPLDWSRPAKEIHNKVRGLTPWPATSTDAFTEQPVKIYKVMETGERTTKEPGTVLRADKRGIDLACGDGMTIRILELQASGSKRMAAADYLRGHPIQGM